jgi:transcriptional regulator with XRE-family HTH domain
MSEFPERLRKLRERKRLKRYVLSERCGLNSDAIRRYELGTAKPTMDALKSIADEFGVSVDYLMGRTDYPCVADIAEK